MSARVLYNENDPFAAAWLRELIAAGLIAPGVVDERDIRDIRADELAGFVQCHFFAGIGTWSFALRQAGFPDDRPIWTASCPCPPFSSAGPNFRCPECDTRSPVPNAVRTGAFDCIRCGHEWQADGRHLFPELYRLVRECRPELIVGEQVASNDGRTWLDVVSASLEMLGYAFGALDTCAAGFGAPHIRQREYWVADADQPGLPLGSAHSDELGAIWGQGDALAGSFVSSGLAYPMLAGRAERGAVAGRGSAAGGGGAVRMADALRDGAEHASGRRLGSQTEVDGSDRGISGQRLRAGLEGASDGLADAGGDECEPRGNDRENGRREAKLAGFRVTSERPGPTNGFWRDVDWLGCTDGKWRPAEPGTFPLADAGTFRNRVAELRGAGNAINLAQAQGFIEAVMDVLALPQREAA